MGFLSGASTFALLSTLLECFCSAMSLFENSLDIKLTAMTDINKLLKDFEHFAHGQHLHAAFTELLDWVLLPFKRCDSIEEQTTALETYRNHPKVKQLVPLVTLIGDLAEDFNDPIGELYMQAISNGQNGQYFSPMPICDMLTAISLGDNSQPGQTVADCACGSGRMLLAAAKLNRHLQLYGADLDNTCCKMALLNMLFNSLKGEIACMNSLSNEFYRGYNVSTTLINGYHMPYYTEFTDPMLSYIWLKPNQIVQPKLAFTTPFVPVKSSQPMNGLQGVLF